jgi:lysylphosphatidylglycerol synthetase-like protein (DUF2156 family)
VLGVAATVLWPYRGSYLVRPDPQRLRSACAAAAVAVALVLGRGVWMAAWHSEPVRKAAQAALPLLPEEPDRSTQAFVLTVFAAMLVALFLTMAPAPAPPPAGEAERAVPLRVLDRWIELRTLYRFTDKFDPLWRPRQLRMRSWLELIPVGAAALTAEFGARPAARRAVQSSAYPASRQAGAADNSPPF